MQDKVYIDFEYCHHNEVDMGLVCCSLDAGKGTEEYWLLDGTDKESLKRRILECSDRVFVAYNVDMAEGRCFRALGLDPRTFAWNDLMLDWKWLRNADDRYNYGSVLVNRVEEGKEGVKKKVLYTAWSIPPEEKITKRMTQEEIGEATASNARRCAVEAKRRNCRVTNDKAGEGLLDCELFFGVLEESDAVDAKKEKDRMREGMIVANKDRPEVLEQNKSEIMEYCSSDIHLLRELDREITVAMRKVSKEEHLFVLDGEVTFAKPETIIPLDEMRLNMGSWASRLAMYSSRGIPLDSGKYRAVRSSIAQMLRDTQLSWNLAHPDYPVYRIGESENMLAKKKVMRRKSYYKKYVVSRDEGLIRRMIDRYCEATGAEWRRTSKGHPCMDRQYLKEMDDGAIIHDYYKHGDTMSALKSMSPDENGNVKYDNVIGSDYRQHPNFGPYGTKTGRNASKASTFLYLAPKYLRVMVNPKEGTYICDLDYHSQEVAVAAALYNDDNKRAVYKSKDVYIKYAQLAGAYPKDKPILTEDERSSEKWFKEEHWDRVRQIYKGGFLGMQYGMGGSSLQRRVALSLPPSDRDSLAPDFGEKFVEEYHETFAAEFECVSELKRLYKKGVAGGIVLADGWRLGPDDPNILAVGNFPVQGTGAVILRRACQLCDEAGVKVYATLHDAISITGKVVDMDYDIALAVDACKRAARDVLGEDIMQVGNPEIVRHGEAWLHSSDAKDQWNGMAGKYFPQYVIP